MMLCALIAATALLAEPGFAAPVESDSAQVVLIATADADSALVTIDGIEAGVAPVTLHGLAPGTHVVHVRTRQSESWFQAGWRDTLTAAAGDTVRVHARVVVRSQVFTDPPGIPLYAGDSLLGVTPVLLTPGALRGMPLSLRPSGAPEVPLDGIAGGPVMVKVPFGPSKGKERVRSILRGEGGFPLSLVLTGGTAVVSGAAAAAWKVRSGDLAARDPYQADPAVRARVRRLDRSAAIALVVMQAGIAAFLSLLLSD